MKLDEILFLKSLDPDEVDGTIQSVLMREDLAQVPFVHALKFLVKSLKDEKDSLVEDNVRLSNGTWEKKYEN